MKLNKNIKTIIDEIYDECNIIEEVSDSDIFDVIYKLHPRLGMKNKRIVYAHVCNKLFGDDIEDALNAFNN